MVDPGVLDLSSDLCGISNRKFQSVMRDLVWAVYRLSCVTVSSGLIPTHRVVMGQCRVSSRYVVSDSCLSRCYCTIMRPVYQLAALMCHPRSHCLSPGGMQGRST